MSPDLLGLYLLRGGVLAVYQENTSAAPDEVQNTEYRELCVALTVVLFSVLFLQSIAAGKCVLKQYHLNTLRTGSFKLFKRPFPGFLTILTL
jgi:hypothetical protein